MGQNVGGHLVYDEQGTKVVLNGVGSVKTVDGATALNRYPAYLISHNRYLQLRGIRAGGRLVHIEIDHIYITLRTSRQRDTESQWLEDAAAKAPGESRKFIEEGASSNESIAVDVNLALKNIHGRAFTRTAELDRSA